MNTDADILPLVSAPVPIVPPKPAAPARLPLLTDSVKQPYILLWVSMVPQIILLLLNIRAFWIVSGDVNAQEKSFWSLVFGFEVFFLVAVAATAVALRAQKKLVPWGLNWLLVALPIAYLWEVLFNFWDFVPSSTAMWILLPEQLLYFQFMFMMPVIFYGTVRLACFDVKASRAKQILWTAVALVAPPLFWFMIYLLGRAGALRDFPAFASVTLAIVSTVVMLAALIRTCVAGFVALQRWQSVVKQLVMFLVCVGAPIGGLFLNAKVAFPVDFQSWPVYGMALLNGCVLMLPKFRQPLPRRAAWLAQCALFPFTLYFFLVFMPFLPLAIPAIVFFGSGILMLTPTVLFLMHGQKILWGYREETGASADGRLVPALLGAAALAVLPGIVAGEALIDHVVLNKAIDYVYSPNYRTHDDHFTGNLDAAQRSLERLRDSKAGLYLPFLSEFYNWEVFGNLVLPDAKMNTIHSAFFGHDLAAPKSDRFTFLGGVSGRDTMLEESPVSAPPPNGDVTVTNMTTQTVRDGDCERRTVALQISNKGDAQGEFVTSIHIPDGVLISGFHLKIGTENVPGQIFEKKTALWVYQMIRDATARDPGILVYSDPNTVELRVFPVHSGETRLADIEFLYPAGLDPDIRFANQPPPKITHTAALVLTTADDGAATATITPEMLAQFPAAPRMPYLHFIVDRSANSKLTDDQILSAMRAAEHLSAAKECAITFANYESVTQGDPPHEMQPGRDAIPLFAIDSLSAGSLSDGKLLPARGGFLADRAMKRALLAYHEKLSGPEKKADWLGKYPVFVIIHDRADKPVFEGQLEVFQKLAPDAVCYFVTHDGVKFQACGFDANTDPVNDVLNGGGSPVFRNDPFALFAPQPVALLEKGGSIAVCPLPGDKTVTVPFDAGNSSGLAVFDHDKFRDITPTATIAAESPYGRGMHAWRQYLEWVYNPSLGNNGLAGVVNMSRESGILTAATSFIVVENSAQWKELQLKQKQKLGNKAALEFTETPEPSTWVLLFIGMGLFWFARRRQRRKI